MEHLSIHDHLLINNNSFTWRFKSEWMATVTELVDKYLKKPSSYLEIGAGVHNPLGCALVSLGKGANFAAAVEPGSILPESVEQASLLGLIALVQESSFSPLLHEEMHNLIFQTKPETFENGFNLRTSHLEVFNGFIEDYNPGITFDVIHSNAVFEHIKHLDEVCRYTYKLTSPGGIHVHKIDFIDHRYYGKAHPSPDDAFRFMFTGEEDNLGDSNGLRLSQVQSTFIRNGFEACEVHEQWQLPFADANKARLQDRYADMDIDDLSTTCATLVFRKPYP